MSERDRILEDADQPSLTTFLVRLVRAVWVLVRRPPAS